MTFTSEITWINAFNFVIFSCYDLNSGFVANVATILSNSALFMNSAIADVSTKFSPFMLLATISLFYLS